MFIDVREGEELQKTGTVQGAIHVPRGLSESQADPASPSHNPELGSGRRLVLYCAAGGNRSVPAARSLKEMGTDRLTKQQRVKIAYSLRASGMSAPRQRSTDTKAA